MDNKEILKTYYETGDKPTQEQYRKFIDACVGTLEKTDDLPAATSAQENVIYQIGTAFYQCKVLSGVYGWKYIGSLGADGKVRYDAGDVDGDYLSNRVKAGNDMDVQEGAGEDENKAVISLKEITLESPTATDTPITTQSRITVLLQNLLNLWKGLYDGKLGYLQVTFSYTGETLTSTKTVAEILAAITANKQIIANYLGIPLFITENIAVNGDIIMFTFLANLFKVTITGDGSGETDSWTLLEETIEKTENKVSEWSETPTDTNYPSEKLVADTLANKADLVGGLVPASQLPSFVDDVVELRTYSDTAPTTDLADGDKYYAPTAKLIYTYDLDTTSWDAGVTPERGKIYVVLDDSVLNKQYRWGGSDMAAIVNSDIAGLIHSSETKDLIHDNDEIGIVDSENGNVLKKTAWSNIKTKLTTLFDTVYIKLSNLVTSISSSSTNTQVPSAKLLYDKLQLKANLINNTFVSTELPRSSNWNGIAYGNGKLVAIDYTYQCNKVAYSIDDGKTWLEATLPVSAYWIGIAYGNGKFVIVGNNGNFCGCYSEDAVNWTSFTIPNLYIPSRVFFVNSLFVFTQLSSLKLIHSADCINFVEITPSRIIGRSLCYGNGIYVDAINTGVSYSYDLITWVDVSGFSTSTNWQKICYGMGIFVCLNTANSYKFIYSEDGKTWIESTLSTFGTWNDIAFGNNTFMAVGNNTNKVAYSTNGKNWSSTTLTDAASFHFITYGNGKFVVVSYGTNICSYLDITTVNNLSNQRINYDAKDIFFDKTVSNLETDNTQGVIDELAAKKEKVKYDASDPTAGYIADKFVAGTGISLAEGTGANENKLVITSTGASSGDMTKVVYDPNNVNGDAFDMDNMVEGDTNLILNCSERTKIGVSLTYFTLTYYQAKPATCTTGETCFDTTDGKIYTATDTDTWDSGVTASTSVIYIWQQRLYQYISGTTLSPLAKNRKLRKSPTVTSNAFVWNCSGESSKSFVSNNANTTCTVTPVSGDEDTEHSLLFTNSDASNSRTISFAAASGFTLKMLATTLTIPASGFVELSVELYGTVCYIKYSIN